MLNHEQTPSVNAESMQLAMYNCRKNLEMQPKKRAPVIRCDGQKMILE